MLLISYREYYWWYKQDNKDNEHRSGFYVILHLRHHFDPRHSKTFLTLARDTYGYYVSKK